MTALSSLSAGYSGRKTVCPTSLGSLGPDNTPQRLSLLPIRYARKHLSVTSIYQSQASISHKHLSVDQSQASISHKHLSVASIYQSQASISHKHRSVASIDQSQASISHIYHSQASISHIEWHLSSPVMKLSRQFRQKYFVTLQILLFDKNYFTLCHTLSQPSLFLH